MQYFKKMDMFGQPIGFEECGSVTYKTWQGAIFTLIVLIIGSVLSFLFGQEIYERKESISSFGKELVEESIINFHEESIIFAVSHLNGTVIQNPFDYFDVVVENYSVDDKLIVKKNLLSIAQCTPETLPARLKNTLCDLSPGCMCLDNKDKSLSFMNNFANRNSRAQSFHYFPCDSKKRKCPSDLNAIIRNFYISVGIMNSFVDTNNYLEPITYYRQNLPYLQSKDFYTRVLISMTNNTLISDNGWLIEDKVKHTYAQVSNQKSEISTYYTGITPIGTITFESPNIVDKINRHYMKIQDLFAKVGGMLNALIIITKIFSSHYIRFLYLLKLVKLSKEKNTNKINFNEKRPNNSNIEKINISSIQFKQENKEKIKDIKEIKSKGNSSFFQDFNEIEKEVEESMSYEKSYLTYISHILCCKTSKLGTKKQMKLIENKLDVNISIKMMNYFYYNKHQVSQNS